MRVWGGTTLQRDPWPLSAFFFFFFSSPPSCCHKLRPFWGSHKVHVSRFFFFYVNATVKFFFLVVLLLYMNATVLFSFFSHFSSLPLFLFCHDVIQVQSRRPFFFLRWSFHSSFLCITCVSRKGGACFFLLLFYCSGF